MGERPEPIPDACVWLNLDIPDANFEKRWSRSEKEYATALNCKILEKCRHISQPCK